MDCSDWPPSLDVMNLSPNLVAEILERQGVLTNDQARELRKEGQLLPERLRDPRAFQQRAVAYELVESLRFEGANGSTKMVSEEDVGRAIATDAGVEFVSDTDTEVIPQLISLPLRDGLDFPAALRAGTISTTRCNAVRDSGEGGAGRSK